MLNFSTYSVEHLGKGKGISTTEAIIGSNMLNLLTAMKDQDRISPYNIIQ